MNFATQDLPTDYVEVSTIDIKKDRRLLLLLNLAGLIILVIAGSLFAVVIAWLRPEQTITATLFLSINSLADLARLVLSIIGLTAINLILHEAIHGIFFWIFTRSTPHFAFRGSYAYAAAPGWYIFRNPFLVTTMAPLFFISLGGLLLTPYVPPSWLAGTWFVITLNASGAAGDICVAWWILRQPKHGLIQDHGDAVTLFLPKNSANSPI